MTDLDNEFAHRYVLSEEEKRIIRPEDQLRCSIIKSLSFETRHRLYLDLYYLPSQRSYNLEQAAWIKTKIDLANKREGRDVSGDPDFLDTIRNDPSHEEFRIDYAVRHNKQVKKPRPEGFNELAMLILKEERKDRRVLTT